MGIRCYVCSVASRGIRSTDGYLCFMGRNDARIELNLRIIDALVDDAVTQLDIHKPPCLAASARDRHDNHDQ